MKKVFTFIIIIPFIIFLYPLTALTHLLGRLGAYGNQDKTHEA